MPPVRINRKQGFSFGLARKFLAHYEGTPLHLDMRSVSDKLAESLAGDITIEPDWLSEHMGVMPEDCVTESARSWKPGFGPSDRVTIGHMVCMPPLNPTPRAFKEQYLRVMAQSYRLKEHTRRLPRRPALPLGHHRFASVSACLEAIETLESKAICAGRAHLERRP